MSKKSSICWDCANACGRCSWSHNFTPVKGWIVTPTKFNIHENKMINSYIVHKCPLFKKESKDCIVRVSGQWLAYKFGGISRRTVNRMPVAKLIEKCNNLGLNIQIKYQNGDRLYYLIKKQKKNYTCISGDILKQFWGTINNTSF